MISTIIININITTQATNGLSYGYCNHTMNMTGPTSTNTPPKTYINMRDVPVKTMEEIIIVGPSNKTVVSDIKNNIVKAVRGIPKNSAKSRDTIVLNRAYGITRIKNHPIFQICALQSQKNQSSGYKKLRNVPKTPNM